MLWYHRYLQSVESLWRDRIETYRSWSMSLPSSSEISLRYLVQRSPTTCASAWEVSWLFLELGRGYGLVGLRCFSVVLTLPQEKQRMGMIMFWLGEFETGGSCGWGVVKRCRSEGHQTMLRWDSCGECL